MLHGVTDNVLVSQCAHHSYKNGSRKRKKTATWLIVGIPSLSVLFAVLGVELEQQPEGGEAEQEGLYEPHAAGGCTVDALVSVKERKT